MELDALKSDFDSERRRLLEERARLEDVVSELRLKRNAEVDSFRRELDRLTRQLEDRLEKPSRKGDKLLVQGLSRGLHSTDDALQQAEHRVFQLEAEKKQVFREIVDFGEDLKATRQANTTLGQQLEVLQRDLERRRGQTNHDLDAAQKDYRVAKDRLETAKRQMEDAIQRADGLEQWKERHTCGSCVLHCLHGPG